MHIFLSAQSLSANIIFAHNNQKREKEFGNLPSTTNVKNGVPAGHCCYRVGWVSMCTVKRKRKREKRKKKKKKKPTIGEKKRRELHFEAKTSERGKEPTKCLPML